MHIVKDIMEKQTTAREELGHLRMTWYLKATEGKPVRQKWETFKEKLKKVRRWAGQWLSGRMTTWHTWSSRFEPQHPNKQVKRNVECYLSRNQFWYMQCDRASKPSEMIQHKKRDIVWFCLFASLQPNSQRQRSGWMLPGDARGRGDGELFNRFRVPVHGDESSL